MTAAQLDRRQAFKELDKLFERLDKANTALTIIADAAVLCASLLRQIRDKGAAE